MSDIEYLKKQATIIVNLYNSKNHDEVIRKSKILIKKYSNQIIFYNSLSLSLIAKGKNEEAIKYLNQALKYEPNNIFVLNNLGLTYLNLNNFKKAEFYLQETLKKNPNFFDAMINYGNLFLNMNKHHQASTILDKAVKISNNDYQKEIALFALGNLYQQNGNFLKSEKIYKEILEIHPKNTKADKAISLMHRYKNSNDNHLIEMEKKVSKINNDENFKPLYFALGKAYEDIGDTEKSFHFIQMGNKIEKKQINYKIENDKKLFIKITDLFSDNELKQIDNPEKKNDLCCGYAKIWNYSC